ncbi:hypothetical protein CONPUDRAFT_70997 [Coniophora puteana RWD-64-598 SS2]|uniref:Uncharacterized protein n=1 Tax=Coniophora puteana (strain RWD-64-598) TaxID=741705 RepID=A0A5M3MZT4_CONPW|nr:uncharacterized protein CONPUDRAFT_70997 [Coniophora puteana RWD-64-598 SS2]EIW84155.1 hypothetical protein CONPUDRAFT_70997 [Coniophora puteana RWD-64-598 SS2]
MTWAAQVFWMQILVYKLPQDLNAGGAPSGGTTTLGVSQLDVIERKGEGQFIYTLCLKGGGKGKGSGAVNGNRELDMGNRRPTLSGLGPGSLTEVSVLVMVIKNESGKVVGELDHDDLVNHAPPCHFSLHHVQPCTYMPLHSILQAQQLSRSNDYTSAHSGSYINNYQGCLNPRHQMTLTTFFADTTYPPQDEPVKPIKRKPVPTCAYLRCLCCKHDDNWGPLIEYVNSEGEQ